MIDPRDVLHRYPLFAVLDPAWVDSWLGCGRNLAVDTGDVLFQAGTLGLHVCIVQAGRIRVLRPNSAGRPVPLGLHGPGELFGEYALVPPGLNTATCRAAEPSRIFQLPLAALQQTVATAPEVRAHLKAWMRLHALLGYIREQGFLGFMSMTSVLPLLDCFETLHYRGGEALQAEGLSVDHLFVIRSGSVSVHAGQPRLLGPGDCLGERALVGRADLPLAEAVGDVVCLALSREVFHTRRPGASISQQTFREPAVPGKPFLWVRQEEAADCGLAALSMVARYHGREASPAQLRPQARLEFDGLRLTELGRLAGTLGLRAQAVRISPEHLPAVSLPAIAHLSDGHYVVVYALRPEGVVLGDPARGIITLALPVFQRDWSNHLLLLAPDKQ